MNIEIGVVQSEIARITLRLGPEEHRRRVGDELVLAIGGIEHRFAIGMSSFLDEHPRKARWGALADDPMAQQFADVAPGDHVVCELAGWRLSAGTRVAIGLEDDAVVVLALVTGDDEGARSRVERALTARQPQTPAPVEATKEPAPHRPWRGTIAFYVVLGLAGTLVAALTWDDPRTLFDRRVARPLALFVLAPSLVAISMALLLALSRPWFDVVDSQTAPARWRAAWSKGSLTLGLFAGFLLAEICVGLAFLLHHPLPTTAILLFVAAAVTVLALALALHGQRTQRRLLRLLRGARRGTLVAERTPLASEVRYDREARFTSNGGERAAWYDGIRTARTHAPFSVEIEGTPHAVSGNRVLWAAPLAYIPLTSKERDAGKVIAKTRAVIEPGASVLVRGRTTMVDGTLAYQATGAESFVMFGAPGNARSALRLLALRWFAGVALLVAIAAGSVWFGVHLITLEPRAPISAERE